MGFLSNLAISLGLKDRPKPEGYEQMTAEAARQQQIAEALASPNFGAYSGKFQSEEDAIRRSIAQALSGLQTADVRQRARTGKYGLLNDERRDETLARSGMQAYDAAKEAARARTRQYLLDSAGVSRGALSGFNAGAQIDSSQREADYKASTLIPEFVASRLFPKKALLDGTPTRFDPGEITWNGPRFTNAPSSFGR